MTDSKGAFRHRGADSAKVISVIEIKARAGKVPPANEDNSFNGILAHAMKKQEYNEHLSNLNDCDEWECAWWVNDKQKCAVAVIAERAIGK